MSPTSHYETHLCLLPFNDTLSRSSPAPTPTPPHPLSNPEYDRLTPTATGIRCTVTTENEEESIGLLTRQQREEEL